MYDNNALYKSTGKIIVQLDKNNIDQTKHCQDE